MLNYFKVCNTTKTIFLSGLMISEESFSVKSQIFRDPRIYLFDLNRNGKDDLTKYHYGHFSPDIIHKLLLYSLNQYKHKASESNCNQHSITFKYY